MSNLVHILDECQDCDFHTKSSFPFLEKIRDELIFHSKETGHTVILETGYSWRYENGVQKL